MPKSAFSANIFGYFAILGIVNCQNFIQLCPSSGTLHLPPSGCALKKNYVVEQNCYTIGVVCKGEQSGTSGAGESTVAAETSTTSSTGKGTQGVTAAASVDASAEQQNVYKPDSFCPLYNESVAVDCGGQRECGAHTDCGVTRVCCHDAPCGKKICKDKLLPCPPENETFPEDCVFTSVVDPKRNCFQKMATCKEVVPLKSENASSSGTEATAPESAATTTSIAVSNATSAAKESAAPVSAL